MHAYACTGSRAEVVADRKRCKCMHTRSSASAGSSLADFDRARMI